MSCSMMDVAALKEAQTRLQAVYDPQRFRAAAQEWADTLSAHLEQVIARQPRVLNWADPAANIAEAERWLDRPAAEFGDIVQQMLDRGHNLHHPRYIGHQVPAPVPIAGLFDAVGAVTNQVMAIYEMGPWATAVERALVNRLGEQVGWPRDSFAGLVTHGGSLGNLTGLLTARNVMLGGSWEEGVTTANVQPVIVVHGDAHYSVARAAGVIGLGTKHVLRAALDGRQRLDPQKLDDQLAELRAQGRRVVGFYGLWFV
jgi:L-2,4-diaminobutyrate decarboxylase